MNKELQRAKQMIRPYLRQISNHALLTLTAKAQDGDVCWTSLCDCVRGIVGLANGTAYSAEDSLLARQAEIGLKNLAEDIYEEPISCAGLLLYARDFYRNRRLLPMCRAELKRRDALRAKEEYRLVKTEETYFEAKHRELEQ